MMKKVDLKIIVWQEGENFVAFCLNNNISSFGDSKDEALENIDEALKLYFEDDDLPFLGEIKNPQLIESSLTYA